MRYRLQLVALVLAISIVARAQSASTVRGTVSTAGENNERTYLANIQVSLECQGAEGKARKSTTDDSGQFVFSDVPLGHCVLKVVDPQFEETPTVVNTIADNPVEVDLRVRI